MKLIIDSESGTILPADSCYIVDTASLEDGAMDVLDFGSDGDIAEIGKKHGVSVDDIGKDTGWGDNKYRWTVSYSPKSLCDEAVSYIESGIYWPGEAEYDALKWLLIQPPHILEQISDYIMADELVWHTFKSVFVDNLLGAREFISNALTVVEEPDKSVE